MSLCGLSLQAEPSSGSGSSLLAARSVHDRFASEGQRRLCGSLKAARQGILLLRGGSVCVSGLQITAEGLLTLKFILLVYQFRC